MPEETLASTKSVTFSSVLEESPTNQSDTSSHVQEVIPANEAKDEVSVSLECQPCHDLNVVRLGFRQGCKSLVSWPNKAKAEVRLLAESVEKRVGFIWLHATQR